jgi:hypothetical protein
MHIGTVANVVTASAVVIALVVGTGRRRPRGEGRERGRRLT